MLDTDVPTKKHVQISNIMFGLNLNLNLVVSDEVSPSPCTTQPAPHVLRTLHRLGPVKLRLCSYRRPPRPLITTIPLFSAMAQSKHRCISAVSILNGVEMRTKKPHQNHDAGPRSQTSSERTAICPNPTRWRAQHMQRLYSHARVPYYDYGISSPLPRRQPRGEY